MKRLLLFLLLFSTPLYAVDETLCFTVPDASVQDFVDAYLTDSPVPDENTDGVPDFTVRQWIRRSIRKDIRNRWQNGKILLREQAQAPIVVDETIITTN